MREKPKLRSIYLTDSQYSALVKEVEQKKEKSFNSLAVKKLMRGLKV